MQVTCPHSKEGQQPPKLRWRLLHWAVNQDSWSFHLFSGLVRQLECRVYFWAPQYTVQTYCSESNEAPPRGMERLIQPLLWGCRVSVLEYIQNVAGQSSNCSSCPYFSRENGLDGPSNLNQYVNCKIVIWLIFKTPFMFVRATSCPSWNQDNTEKSSQCPGCLPPMFSSLLS